MENTTDMLSLNNKEKIKAHNYINNLYKINEKTFVMLFVGSGNDYNNLKKYITNKKLNEIIILCVKITDRKILSYYYERSNLFLFPSMYDNNDIVQLEAANQETPGLFTKGSCTSALVKNNENGFLSDLNIIDYVEKLKEITNNNLLYDKVAKNAKRDLYKTWDHIVEKVYKRYQEIIKERTKNEII